MDAVVVNRHTEKYGYMLNVNHPKINALYQRYKKNVAGTFYPLSDPQRKDFEKKTLEFYNAFYKNRYKENFRYPGSDFSRALMNELINALPLPTETEGG